MRFCCKTENFTKSAQFWSKANHTRIFAVHIDKRLYVFNSEVENQAML